MRPLIIHLPRVLITHPAALILALLLPLRLTPPHHLSAHLAGGGLGGGDGTALSGSCEEEVVGKEAGCGCAGEWGDKHESPLQPLAASVRFVERAMIQV